MCTRFIFLICFFWLTLLSHAQQIHQPTDCVGEIAGECIMYKDFLEAIQEAGANSRITERQAVEIVWNNLLYEKVFLPEIKKVGLELSREEFENLLWGDSAQVHPIVRENFWKRETNTFDKEKRDEMKKVAENNPIMQKRIDTYHEGLGKDKLRSNLEELMRTSTYITKAEIKQAQNEYAESSHIRYVYVPYYALADSLFLPTITTQDLEVKLRSHPQKYKAHAMRTLVYLTIPVNPSMQDSLQILRDLGEVGKQWKKAKNKWQFAQTHGEQDSTFKAPNNLSDKLFAEKSTLKKGYFSPPISIESYNQPTQYAIYHVQATKNEPEKLNLRASHILFKADRSKSESEKEQAKIEAQTILDSLKKGADFAQMARKYGTDGTTQNGGDLGWFSKGMMVKSFENACFGAKKTGLLPTLVQTDFGYHIVAVTALPTSLTYQMAVIKKYFVPSQATQDIVKQQVDVISPQIKSANDLIAFAKQNPQYKFEEDEVTRYHNILNDKNSHTSGPKHWAFNAEEGAVKVFIMDSNGNTLQHIFIGIKHAQEEGEISIKASRKELTQDVLRDKKASYITSRLSLNETNLEKIAEKYGTGAVLREEKRLTLEKNALQEGYEPEVVGKAMGLPKGKKTVAVGENGVYVIEKIADFSEELNPTEAENNTNTLLRSRESMSSYHTQEALKKLNHVKDYRYKFF